MIHFRPSEGECVGYPLGKFEISAQVRTDCLAAGTSILKIQDSRV